MSAAADVVLDLDRPLVVGFGVTGRAVARALLRHGHDTVVVDDRPGEAAVAEADALGLGLVVAPDAEALRKVVGDATVVLPAPGLPHHHPVFALARQAGVPIASEFDLAARWDDRPLVAITGTNGKTTVTMMVTDALERSGKVARAVGNTEVPLVDAIDDPTVDTFVVECSSFRLGHSLDFRPTVAAWLNFAPDHLDAHASLEEYRAAKASIFARLGEGDVAVVAAEDAVVASAAAGLGDRPGITVESFGLTEGDWRVADAHLVGPVGPIVAVERLARTQPHDLRNAAAAAAIAIRAGATVGAVAEMLAEFGGLAHRVQFVAEIDGVRWFNDSKATVPHATLAALGGFESVVLIAGGRNKGLDLSSLGTAVPPVRAVVATGDAADEVAAAFAGTEVEVGRADSMTEAIDRAAAMSRPGDVVLLSPSCTSYDWYPNYGARGDDFMRLVKERLA